jgi:hypothetical protein
MDPEQLTEQARRAALAFGNLAQSLAGMLRPLADRLGALYLDTEEAKATLQGLARPRVEAGDDPSTASTPPDAS